MGIATGKAHHLPTLQVSLLEPGKGISEEGGQTMTTHYQLIVINDNGKELQSIGIFDSEQDLAQWAKENPDTLRQYEEEE